MARTARLNLLQIHVQHWRRYLHNELFVFVRHNLNGAGALLRHKETVYV